jgi:hypothetical protein
MPNYSVNDFDIFYISYDEPNAEENWARIVSLLPAAKRVHGVKGFDTAHKTVGERATTDRVFTIDGDNWVLDEFQHMQFDLRDEHSDHIFSWAGRNSVNGLCYGNGGIKLWPRETILNLNSHENATSERGRVDFCWDWIWNQQDKCYSETVVNATPYQAFRAGFREGVKMSLDRGAKMTKEKFNTLNTYNMQRLRIWCSVGADVRYGDWAMFGARLGTYKTNLTDWDHNLIADYDWFEEYWREIEKDYGYADTRWRALVDLGEKLYEGLHFETADFQLRESRFWKQNYVNPSRGGIIHPGQM